MNHAPTIQLIAPSGWANPEAQARGVVRLREAGCEVRGEDACERRWHRFAGTDQERAADINRWADSDTSLPDIALAVRGGYGVHRILPLLDYAGLRERLTDQPFMLVGHSDITALHLALLARSGLTTFAGPMLAHDFGGEQVSRYTHDAFWDTVGHAEHAARWMAGTTQAVDAQGTLWGGNLATLCSLLGTPYLPDVDHGILFLEDVGEPLFRIERMLLQLKLAGVLDRQAAVLLGDFSDSRADAYDPMWNMDAIVTSIRSCTDVPVITGLPFGHCRDKLTLPVGAPAWLAVEEGGQAVLAFSDYPHFSHGTTVPSC